MQYSVQVCEKEMKTKAFSKEGLGQAAKLDPRDKARNEMRDWINETVDKLGAEVGCALAESSGATVSRQRGVNTVALKPPGGVLHEKGGAQLDAVQVAEGKWPLHAKMGGGREAGNQYRTLMGIPPAFSRRRRRSMRRWRAWRPT